MKIQAIVSDVRTRVETAGKQYQDAFKAYFNAHRQAVSVVTKNGQTLANTEIGAAKNLFAAAKTSFDKARQDGMRKVANNPQAYVPSGRDQIVSAYKDTINLLVQTGNELSKVVTSGYKSVIGKLAGGNKTSPARKSAKQTASSTAGRKSTATKTSAAKRKTASTRSNTTASSTPKSASSTTGTTARKRSATKTAGASASSTSGNGSAS